MASYRLLRDWTDSETVDKLSPEAEVLFTRLIMKADDFGAFHGNVKLIKSALFPLKDYTLKQIANWLAECMDNGLIIGYTSGNKPYIMIKNFGQRLQNFKNAFPKPDNKSPEVTVSHRESPPEEKGSRREVETEPELELEVWPTFEDFWNMYDKKVDRPKCEKAWGKLNQQTREIIMERLPAYRHAQPDKKFRKDPYSYLYNKSYENEIINTNTNGKQNTSLADSFRELEQIYAERSADSQGTT